MNTRLEEIRERMAQHHKEYLENIPDPISYEKYKMWQLLKKPIPDRIVDYGKHDGIFICQTCGGDHLHHIGVEMFSREEDSKEGLHVSLHDETSYGWRNGCLNVIPPECEADNDMAKNPSKRRGGITISFVCEECASISEFSVAQHKGYSLWRMKTI